ncbi:MAG: helix-turn-helix transcriptional regulator [Bacteroidota bacterium]|nr:helix-turn-helix transcriptional regulator [Bacteroidota bacterium]MDP4218530.1 helix-turn-helix transcriptional regulator [Bacteroidota bacterium]MDP4244909.1 helix-turn-helix transcriptional regulator [Bacteroidota bacterium]MDP4254115.1 helix-turn-helix transcriptional regulator [Bacteroidota bacterium]MDP4257137.1 helix-turn-helix transcriptional regulator [Bacteroidota bacterium]
MIRYTYHLKDFRSWLKGFSKALSLPVMAGRIRIPPERGDGYILAANINPDISYIVMDFALNEELVLARKKSATYGLSLFFNQTSVSEFFEIRESNNGLITDKATHRSNIFFSSTNYDLQMTYSGQSRLKRVGIFFSPAFVSRCVKKNILLDLMLYADNRLRNINKEPITFEYRQLLEDIFQADRDSPVSHLILQNRILLLAEKFLSTFLVKAPQRKETGPVKAREKEKDILALRNVEQILSNNKLDKFPSIEILSKTAMMSTTKLKTKFKQIYGMKLYEFYNRNRLETAKEMLKTGNYSVKQVGYNIGFSNLSNFAKAFKKEFGLLPKDIMKGK